MSPLLLALTLIAPEATAGQQGLIDTLLLKSHTFFLAQDALEGRSTGTPGEAVAALYIEAECRRLGLNPVGRAFRHEVSLAATRVLSGTGVTVLTARDTVSLPYPSAITPNVGSVQTLRDFEGQAAYVGDRSMIEQGRLGSLDLSGAVAVTNGMISPVAFDTLLLRGAVGAIHALETPERYQLYRRSRGELRLSHADTTVVSSFLPPLPSVIAGPWAWEPLLAGPGADRPVLTEPRALQATVRFHLVSSTTESVLRNVACLLPGSEPAMRDTAIAFTAHLDHLGIGVPDSRGDSIYNGFSDNAAGVAMLLAIAEAMKGERSSTPRHSVLFLFFSGEERGLLGSDYYVAHPPWPLQRTKAVINLDAGAPPAPPTSWRLAVSDSSGLGGLARQVADARGWSVTTSQPRANSDYYPFVRSGVPAIFIIPGPDPYEGHSEDSSRQLRERWDRYHQPGDEWSESFPFAGLRRYAEYAYLVARAIDGGSGSAGRGQGR
ncbi:MAG: M28 family peptidase [Gemmatimonadales bacterium]